MYFHLHRVIPFLTIFLIPLSFSYPKTEEEIKQEVEEHLITCGSSLRIQNEITKFYLSSFGMNWSTGSRLQIITGVKEDNKYESLFIIKEGEGLTPCENGEPIKCDSIIRLEHIKTGKNLHSHEFPSMISGAQEACAFGDNGNGDVNDNFKIVCYKNETDSIKGSSFFFLQHMATQKYLFIDYKRSMFNDYNCRGCPIIGQREVGLTNNKDKQCLWKVSGGILFSVPEEDDDKKNADDSEGNPKDDL